MRITLQELIFLYSFHSGLIFRSYSRISSWDGSSGYWLLMREAYATENRSIFPSFIINSKVSYTRFTYRDDFMDSIIPGRSTKILTIKTHNKVFSFLTFSHNVFPGSLILSFFLLVKLLYKLYIIWLLAVRLPRF